VAGGQDQGACSLKASPDQNLAAQHSRTGLWIRLAVLIGALCIISTVGALLGQGLGAFEPDKPPVGAVARGATPAAGGSASFADLAPPAADDPPVAAVQVAQLSEGDGDVLVRYAPVGLILFVAGVIFWAAPQAASSSDDEE
jgi:hypothetical protein